MKQLTIVLDGIADRPQAALGGKTPMEAAQTPALDALCTKGRKGTVRTIAKGLEVGSAVANLSLLGYDPKKIYKGRAVIEAAGAGIPIIPNALYVRCNFVTLEGESFEQSVMRSYSAHDIETHKARPLADMLSRKVFGDAYKLIHTDTFRNILVVERAGRAAQDLHFTPAHELIGDTVSAHIKGNAVMQPFVVLMRKAYEALAKDNDTQANGIWFWGASSAPRVTQLPKGRRVVLAETTLMRGIAKLFDIDCVTTPEECGFEAFLKQKAADALKAVSEYDDCYIHIQELDDLSHELEPEKKMRAIEQIDKHFIAPFFEQLKQPYSAVVVSDHFTFSDSGGHGAEPAPFLLLGHGADNPGGRFTEQQCRNAWFRIDAPALVALKRGEA